MLTHRNKAALIHEAIRRRAFPYMIRCLVLLTLLPPATFARPDKTEQGMKGFDAQIVRGEQAGRALRRGKSYLKDKAWVLARSEFNQALELNTDLIEARFCLGLVERGEGSHKLALQQFEAVYTKDPDFKDICLELARSQLEAGNCEAAEIWLKRHLEKNRGSKETLKLERKIKRCTSKRR
ncbi:MAG: hypothetical protein A3F83_02235 [Candidatus Glassbacteria bacterium RIFCSPLOWO2_12_FULL_58_11]|uniref:Uncharacterized protein n=2 Tax=Candidatus Glassiibacteriota TaxID=1817805 RepID=A0A1F5YWH2_9BACT|nr:MAG: hypothetical protein A2Z86_05560 [Candidatus Glassbacteria bacterium GWA2_58_10]OGG04539.1 MAG: hypothetical protein A3F83_02235 [Candidatus Glassbacteria bacterium RIFCSPLOWO2_12_FULL_58_11]